MESELINLLKENPRATIILIAVFVSFISSLITKYTTDQKMIKSIKERQKEIQKELKEKKYPVNDKRYIQLQQEIIDLSGKLLKNSLKPLLITFVPFLLLFYFLRDFFHPLIGNSWIWYYIIASLISSLLYKKILKIA